MKKKCIIIFCTILFCATAACKKTQTENQVQTQMDSTLQNTRTIAEQKLQDYKQFLNKLDTTNLLSSSKAGLEFVEQFKETDLESNDSAYSLFKNFHESMLSSQQSIVDKNNNAYLELFSGYENKASKAIKEKKELLEKNGFYLGTVEGYVYVATLPEFQKNYVFGKLSPAMQTYFIQSQKEETEGTADDGGLLVAPKVLSERLIFWENFLLK